MAVSPEEIQLITHAVTEALKPEFERIDKRFEAINDKFMDLKTYIDTKFEEQQEALEVSFREIIEEIYGSHSLSEEVNSLKKRVTSLENKLDHYPAN